MRKLLLSEDEEQIIRHALEVSLQIFIEDAKKATGVFPRLAEQFQRQADDNRRVLDKLDAE